MENTCDYEMMLKGIIQTVIRHKKEGLIHRKGSQIYEYCRICWVFILEYVYFYTLSVCSRYDEQQICKILFDRHRDPPTLPVIVYVMPGTAMDITAARHKTMVIMNAAFFEIYQI